MKYIYERLLGNLQELKSQLKYDYKNYLQSTKDTKDNKDNKDIKQITIKNKELDIAKIDNMINLIEIMAV